MGWKNVRVVPLDELDKWQLEEDLIYHIGGNEKEIIRVKSGFITDLASIPRALWSIYPPYHPTYRSAAIIHDGLYASEMFPRERADEIFREAMKELGANLFRRNTMYYAVRTFGGSVWKQHSTLSKLDARQFVEYIGTKEKTLGV